MRRQTPVSPPPHRSRSYLRGRCAAAVCVVLLAACGSEPSARPGGDTTTTTTATTIQTAESATTSMATTRPTTTAPIFAPQVIAALGGQSATFRRVDLPLSSNAPANLVAAAPSGVVAIGWRAIGAGSQSASAAFSTDGRQWRTIASPWDDRPTTSALTRSFGSPRALAYADGTFLSVGLQVNVAEDGRPTSTAIAARSVDGTTWESIDLAASPDTLLPTHLVRSGSRWVMAAEPWGGTPPRQTLLFGSSDGRAWERIASLDFLVQHLRATTFGLLAVGSRNEGNSMAWLSAASNDGRTWNSSVLNVGPTSSVQSVLVDTERVVLIVSEDVTGFSKDRRARLSSSRDGLLWQPMPTPPCFAAGDYIGPTEVAGGAWAILINTDSPKLALSFDQGASWSCTALNGDTFETRWGPPYLTGISNLQGSLALVGGRTIEPGAKGNWAAAIWYLS